MCNGYRNICQALDQASGQPSDWVVRGQGGDRKIEAGAGPC
jgi:hypothetical protein